MEAAERGKKAMVSQIYKIIREMALEVGGTGILAVLFASIAAGANEGVFCRVFGISRG
jgi:hypothetical protein